MSDAYDRSKRHQDAKVESKLSPLKSPASIIADMKARRAAINVPPVDNRNGNVIHIILPGGFHSEFDNFRDLALWAVESIREMPQ